MDEQRAEFWSKFDEFLFTKELEQYGAEYAAFSIWQAATQRQQERIAELEAQVQALGLDAGRWRFAASHNAEGRMNFGVVYDAWDGDGSFTDQIDAAIARATHKEQT